jgi:flagellar hook-associated protein 1 FlgK
MASGLLGIGISGLNAAQAGILTTQQNISNVNTAGYHRQETIYAAQTPSFTGSGWFGNGVAVETVQRMYSQFLDGEVQTNQAQLSYYQTYSSQASQVSSLLGDTTNGLSNQVDSFFSAVNAVANDPGSSAARQTLLAAGSNLAGQVSSQYNSLQQQISASNQAVGSMTTQINTYTKQIAGLNQSITRMEAENGQPANDLRDQRDQAIANLNRLVNVTTVQQGNGELNVLIGNSQVLVSGEQAYQFSAQLASDPNDAYNAGAKLPALNVSGTSLTLDGSQITGGELGGLLAARGEVVEPALANLNRIAVAIGAAVNQVHSAGAYYDTATNTMKAGGNFFSGVVAATGATTSTIGINLTSNALQNYDYNVSYNGAKYTVTRNPAGGPAIPAVAAGVEVVDANGNSLGFSISAGTPAPAAGDTWALNLQDYAHSMSTQLTSIDQIATANPADPANLTATAAAANTGTAAISGMQVSAAATLPLPAAVTLTYNAGQFAVAGAVPAVANIAYAAPGPQTLSFNGISFSVSGTPANGDVFTLNSTGAGDNSNMLTLAALQTTPLLDNGNTTFDGAISQMVGDVANKASSADLNSQTYNTLTTQATQAQQSFSGVNLDEEAANLIRYQQAYQAAAKALSVANSLFDSILAIIP